VKQINQLNQGKYLHDVMHIDNKKLIFCVGVSGYPEKHLGPSLPSDLKD
jgi:methylenetetrahydrofolate reductase (NADPH)